MPIGDLLAEISGEKSSSQPKPPPPSSSSSSGLKRKAGDSNGDAAKVTKARHADGSASKITRNSQGEIIGHSRSTPNTGRPAYTGTANKTSTQPRTSSLSSTPTNGRPPSKPSIPNDRSILSSAGNGRPASSSASASSLRRTASDLASRPKLNPAASASKAPPAKPSPTTPTPSDPSKAPKKGSFAEIMARASKAQQGVPKGGGIQHKPIEKLPNKKERDSAKPGAKALPGKPYLGNARPGAASSRDGQRVASRGRDVPKNGNLKNGKQIGKQGSGPAGGDAADKKVKKAATATTGYTGTARPRPNAASKASSARNGKPQAPPRTGGLLAPPKAARRSQYDDEYDEDMDDFIDYDEDDDDPGPQGPRYGYYDSDGSSDMEAGLTDIDEEEKKATFAAIREDKREQELEERLRREKEARKRRLMNQGR